MKANNVEEFTLIRDSLEFIRNWCDLTESNFDIESQSFWHDKMKKGYFRYSLSIKKCKILDGRYRFLAQLNPDRATNRRRPENLKSLREAFNPNSFNFTKVKEEEIIFRFRNEQSKDKNEDYLVINVSPLENGHCLLLPSLYKCLPQVLTKESLELAVITLLNSYSPAFRIGFNSLCAYASVNHLHFHSYYLNFPMLLEYIEVQPLIGRCYQLLNYPAKGYVFQISSALDMEEVVRDVFTITNYFNESEIAHNLYLTRGVSFEEAESRKCKIYGERKVVRLYVWGRSPSTGAKDPEAFNPAVCELFGHLVVKTEEAYENLTEGEVASALQGVTSELFQKSLAPVTRLMEKENEDKN